MTVQPWGPTQVHTFDPTKPAGSPADPSKPGDLPGPPVDDAGKPLIPATENAVAVARLLQTYEIGTTPPDAGGQVTITDVNIALAGHTDIYLPAGADQQLIDHENGHNDLYKDEYDKHAKEKLTQAVNDLVGQKFDSKEAAKKAVENAKDVRGDGALQMQMSLDGIKYDQLNHGRNDQVDPATGKPVDTPTGVAMIKKEQAAIEKFLEEWKYVPANRYQHRSGIIDPVSVVFDSGSSVFTFGGDSIIDDTLNPADTLLGRGRVEIGDLIWVGSKDDGSIHLSDTSLKIFDGVTGDILMNAFLLNVSYTASSLPGFSGMIVAGLDIPPTFAGGINNTINSEFLSGIENLSAAGRPTMFWFYPKSPLFNDLGHPITYGTEITGKLVLGTPVPDSSNLAVEIVTIAGLLMSGRWVKAIKRG